MMRSENQLNYMSSPYLAFESIDVHGKSLVPC